MKELSGNEYRLLYRTWFGRRPLSDLLSHAGDLTGKKVLDLCGGTGELSRAALEAGAAYVIYVDHAPNMIDGDLKEKYKNFSALKCTVAEGVKEIGAGAIDVALCRQGVNYWFDDASVGQLSLVLSRGGVFIFNTFHVEPDISPRTKEYAIDGIGYAEVSWMRYDGMVEHVQAREGMAPHCSTFQWIPPEQFTRVLKKHFVSHASEQRRSSTTWVCRKSGR
jgi:SAM-dependent methyltransferase